MNEEEEFAHYGVKGMKWGIRKDRYSGKRRKYKKSDEPDDSEDYKNAKSIGKKSLNQMTNEEIRQLNQRMQLENQNKQLLEQRRSAGQKFVSDTGRNVLNQSTSQVTGKVIAIGVAVAAGYLAAKYGDRNVDLKNVAFDILDPTKKKK